MGLNQSGGKPCRIYTSAPLIFMASVAIIDEEKSPRGIRGFMLNTGNFSEWRVQGKVGGYTKCVVLSSMLFPRLMVTQLSRQDARSAE